MTAADECRHTLIHLRAAKGRLRAAEDRRGEIDAAYAAVFWRRNEVWQTILKCRSEADSAWQDYRAARGRLGEPEQAQWPEE